MSKVMFYEDGLVIANELLTLSEKTGKRQLDLEDHFEFVKYLASYMESMFGIRLVVMPHEDGFLEWSKEHGDYFTMFKKDKNCFVKLKDDVHPDTIRRRFRAMLPYESCKAFIDNEQKLVDIVSEREKKTSQYNGISR